MSTIGAWGGGRAETSAEMFEPILVFPFLSTDFCLIASVRKVVSAVRRFVVNAGVVLGNDIPLYGEVVSHEGIHSLVNL